MSLNPIYPNLLDRLRRLEIEISFFGVQASIASVKVKETAPVHDPESQSVQLQRLIVQEMSDQGVPAPLQIGYQVEKVGVSCGFSHIIAQSHALPSGMIRIPEFHLPSLTVETVRAGSRTQNIDRRTGFRVVRDAGSCPFV